MEKQLKAGEIFFNAIHFIPRHLSFALYYFLVMAVSELLQFARLMSTGRLTHDAISIAGNRVELTDMSFIVKNYIPLHIRLFLQHPYAPYIFFGFTCILLLVSVSITFIIQALLRKRDTSIGHEVAHTFHALVRAPWAIFYFVAIAGYMTAVPYFASPGAVAAAETPRVFAPLFVLMVVSFIINVVFLYLQPLLYDNYSSLSSVIETSWDYLKKSWFVLAKLLLLGFIINALVVYIAWFSGTIIPAGLPAFAVYFLLRTYMTLVAMVIFNMVYLRVRAEN